MGGRIALLGLGDNVELHLAAKPSLLVTHIGRNIPAAFYHFFQLVGRHIVDVGDLLLETFQCKAGAVAFCQCDTVVFHIVPAAAQNFRDLEGGAGQVGYHGAPHKIAVAHTGQGAAALLGKGIQLMSKGRGRIPRVQGLLTGGDGIDSMSGTDGENVLQLCDSASGGGDAPGDSGG